jgi:D-alanyl-D-alanine carboxypeptidase/D-alanyl-D-alanine-endopeptidase (penicillin-binding protein 4)
MKELILASILLVGGCAISSPPRAPLSPLGHLRHEIDAVLSDSVFVPTSAGIKIVSVATGEVLYERGSKLLVHPASNMKLLISLTALKVLGKDYAIKTAVLLDTLIINGVVYGNVYLRGFGDPNLKTADLDSLAAQLRSMGIRRIAGDVVADNYFFDDLYWGNGWMWDDEPDPDEMYISSLSVNRNCIVVNVAPTAMEGDSVIVTSDPPTSYVSLLSEAKTARDSSMSPIRVSRLFKERLNAITIRGEIQKGSLPLTQRVSLWRPELYAAQLFKEALLRVGILVFGQPRIAPTPLYTFEAANHFWPLDSVVIAMDKISDNLSAENLLKIIGARKRGQPGTGQNGIYVVNESLASFGIDTTRILVADGSGVSHYNLLSPEMIVQLLTAATKSPDLFPLFYESLPIAGIDGTLARRMPLPPAAGNLRAKTGSISGVSTLSGYVKTRDGELLAFSIMMQNFILPTITFRAAQDRIGQLLAGFSRQRTISGAQ